MVHHFVGAALLAFTAGRASTCLHVESTCTWTWQFFGLGTYNAPTSYILYQEVRGKLNHQGKVTLVEEQPPNLNDKTSLLDHSGKEGASSWFTVELL